MNFEIKGEIVMERQKNQLIKNVIKTAGKYAGESASVFFLYQPRKRFRNESKKKETINS